ncbi:MAG: CBM96 family carbohydrate-binding protein [Opitutaceae bacterium]
MNTIKSNVKEKTLATIASLLALSAPINAQTLSPTDDAYIRAGSNANSNNGSSSQLIVKTEGDSHNNTRESLLNFDVNGINGSVQSATLRIYLTKVNGTTTHYIYDADTNWSESSITWNNQPNSYSPALDSANFGGNDDDIWVEYDVTSEVAADVSSNSSDTAFIIVANNSVYSVYDSSEASNAPELIITAVENSEGTVLEPAGDAQVRAGVNANTNYGSSGTAEVKNSGSSHNYTREAWFRFNVGSLSGNVSDAKFRVRLAQCNGNTTHTLSKGADSWSESTITYNNKPNISDPLDSKTFSNADDGIWVEYDVTDFIASEVSQNHNIATLVITANDSVYSKYRTRDHADSPQLIITIGGDNDNGDGDGDNDPDPTPDSDLPSDFLDLVPWKLNIPTDSQGRDETDGDYDSAEITDLIGYKNNPWFVVENGGVRFRAHAGGATTGGSSYPRSELRQMLPDGSSEIYWDDADPQRMTLTGDITAAPKNKPHVIIAQIHAKNSTCDDTLKIIYRGDPSVNNGNPIVAATYVNTSTSESKSENSGDWIDYNLGDLLKVDIIVDNNVVNVFVTNLTSGNSFNFDFNQCSDNDGYYFKAGCYSNSNWDDQGGSYVEDAPDEYGETRIYSLDLQVTE